MGATLDMMELVRWRGWTRVEGEVATEWELLMGLSVSWVFGVRWGGAHLLYACLFVSAISKGFVRASAGVGGMGDIVFVVPQWL